MSQRTRARTTGVAPRRTKPVATDESSASAPAGSARGGRRSAQASALAKAESSAPATAVGFGAGSLSPDALARALRAVAAELERDPALAQRVATAIDAAAAQPVAPVAPSSADHDSEPSVGAIGRSFHPTIVTGVAPDLGAGIPDPFALRKRLGAEGLRAELEGLRLGSLRAIVREHRLDPDGRLSKLNDAAKLRERILQATGGRV